MVCRARPPSTLQEFLEEAAAMNRAGKLTRHALPKGVGAAREAFALAARHREMVTLLFPPMLPGIRAFAMLVGRLEEGRKE
jgi:hypothetical protein